MNDLEDDDFSESDFNDFDIKVKKYSDSVLCDLIVVSRYLNFNQEAALLAMKELSSRRQEGSSFDFESLIEEKSKELPNITSNIVDLKSMFSSII